MVFFFICAISGIFGNQSAICNYISGGTFIVGLLLEIVSRKCDGRLETLTRMAEEEAQKKHQSELNSLTRQIADADEKIDSTAKFTQSLKEGRHLSAAGKAILSNSLSPFAGQKFRVFQLGMIDSEATEFANEIAEFLKECGWLQVGILTCLNPSESTIIMSWGVSFHAIPESSKTSDEIIASRTLRAVAELCLRMQDVGVIAATSMRSSRFAPIPPGMIEIHVGEKPPPHIAHGRI